MMLVNETRKLHTTLLGSLRQTRPVHMSRDVSVTNIFEWRLQMSMTLTDLQRAAPQLRIVKIGARKTVIEHKDQAALHLRGDIVDPIMRGQVNFDLVTSRQARRLCHKFVQGRFDNRLINEHEIVVIGRNKLFLPTVISRDK